MAEPIGNPVRPAAVEFYSGGKRHIVGTWERTLCSQCDIHRVEHDGDMCEGCALDIHSQQDGWVDG